MGVFHGRFHKSGRDWLRALFYRLPEEESPAAKELRSMIKHHLEEEIKKLRVSMEDQLKVTEEALNKKLNSAEGKEKAPSKKGSAKGKKKWTTPELIPKVPIISVFSIELYHTSVHYFTKIKVHIEKRGIEL